MVPANTRNPEYLAPEVISCVLGYDAKLADIWSIGVIAFSLLAGSAPFDRSSCTLPELLEKIKAVEYDFPNYISTEARDLISGILVADVSRRFCMR